MEYEQFEEEIRLLTGINLLLYKEKQMKRRILTLIEHLGLDGFESYLDRLRNDKNSLEYFLQYITINVTEFFRTQEQWNYMANNVLPKLTDEAVIWSCACSTGEEPYSLAISIAERRPLANIRIIATDIDEKVLEFARKGEYTLRTMDNVYKENFDKYFTKTEKGYQISDEIKSHVEFRKLNLLSFDTPNVFPKNCDLIVCRNVLIYFNDEAKRELYQRFNECLRPGGHLFTGHTEQILRYKEYNYLKEQNYLYKKDK